MTREGESGVEGASADGEGLAVLAREMARFGNERDAPARSVMAMLGDRWTTLILLVLAQRPTRHADLKRALERLSHEKAISQRVLTLKLRALERDGFVVREVSGDVPPRVSYRLSPQGEDLARQARAMIDWINLRSEAIRAAREAYDAADTPD
ncbi:helix-turn-helix transcriptional regulator [Novosphingobium profundi]|uniref:winged helix-turn-helix transcriptional regulator n=1 Tax=Novosphingobium profundi TaxID=1774954 RepID=UPI001BD9EC31|nr:helix-turn-helix domain-containing protein [Novosphingobium profundi]MBT0668252.1 helix-turn-helix transcriptional regulator [Novosphingobium profundi]